MADLVISVRNPTREYLMGTEVVLEDGRVESDRLNQGKAA